MRLYHIFDSVTNERLGSCLAGSMELALGYAHMTFAGRAIKVELYI